MINYVQIDSNAINMDLVKRVQFLSDAVRFHYMDGSTFDLTDVVAQQFMCWWENHSGVHRCHDG